MEVRFGHSDPWTKNKWEMTIDLKAFCNLEGVKETNPETNKKYLVYPLTKVKKLFKLMVQNMEPEELNKVQEYLNSSSKSYAAVFKQIIEKGR